MELPTSDDSAYYTLVMLDIDSPDRATCDAGNGYRSVLHWLLTNIRGSDLRSATTVAAYLRPQPQQGTGTHRVVFLLFRQPDYISVRESYWDLDSRLRFDANRFAAAYDLGPPVQGNWREIQWDYTVPQEPKYVLCHYSPGACTMGVPAPSSRVPRLARERGRFFPDCNYPAEAIAGTE